MNTLPRIDVHGLTSNEAESHIRKNLLAFKNMGFLEVHIIHGHGQGILKKRVRELMNILIYIDSYRPGRQNEGGDGVTVAIFN
jgi:DNA mismatch repair protein MutS2